MIPINIPQGSSEWRLQRYGICTASEADNLITPARWESTSGDKKKKYLQTKIAERIALLDTADIKNAEERCAKIESILNRVQTESMLHGVVSEPRAVNAYEFLTGLETEPAGFMLNNSKTAGASLDRLIKGTKRGLEIKSPFSLSVYVGYCLNKGVDSAYMPQLQFQLWISELESIDIYAWYEGRSESEPITVPRNEEKISALAEHHAKFSEELERAWSEWLERKQKS